MSESGANEGTPGEMLWEKEKGEILMLKSEIPRGDIPGHIRQQILSLGVSGDERSRAELCAGKDWVVFRKVIRRKSLM